MKIFVGSIRNTVTEQDLGEMFSNFGEVEAILYKGKYAFVFMPDDEQAKAACAALHQSEIKGCKINVENATPGKQGERFKSNPADFVRPPSDDPVTKQSGKAPRFHHQFGRIKLIFGNIGSTTEAELCELVSPVAEIHETYILPGDKGVGFLHVDEAKAEEVIEKFHGYRLNGEDIRVAYSVSKDIKIRPGRDVHYVKLFIPGIPENAKSDILRQRFEMFGDVKEAVVVGNKKVAFVSIDARAAQYAMDKLNGIKFYGKELRIELARGEFIPAQAPTNQPLLPDHMGSVMKSGYNGPPPMPREHTYPPNNPQANFELGPGFGGNQPSKMAALPPPPTSPEELKELIEKRCKLEMVHPYEKMLIETYDGNSKAAPQTQPPPEYLRLVRDRAILKVRLLRAQERGFDVYGTAMTLFQTQNQRADPYGFGNADVSVKVASDPVPPMTYNANSVPNFAADQVWNGNATAGSYHTAYANNQAGGPIQFKRENVQRHQPY